MRQLLSAGIVVALDIADGDADFAATAGQHIACTLERAPATACACTAGPDSAATTAAATTAAAINAAPFDDLITRPPQPEFVTLLPANRPAQKL